MSELGSCVRAWRERLTPEAAGLRSGGHRRTKGLRREELAALAGVSVDYLVRLEQGRAVNPSVQVAASLARALRLTDEERDHLYRIAGHALPSRQMIPSHIPPGVQRLLDRLDAAVAVHDAAWAIVAWNPAYAALVGDPSSWAGRDRNVIWAHFTGSRGSKTSRLVRTPDQVAAFEREAVADLRAASGRYPHDPLLGGLIADLHRISPRFSELWSTVEVGIHQADRKTFDHPEVGPVTLDCDVLLVPASDLRVIAYTAVPGSVDAEKFDLVRVIGLQRLASPT